MAFLDNSGDIILDAVLTDAGRKRLARADGTFKIVKFALGDDEIDYGLYNYNNASGSAYYDLSLLQTPILEAFTNNTSILKSKLITVPQTNLLFLPRAKLNDVSTLDYNAVALSPNNNAYNDGGDVIYITVDNLTEASGNPKSDSSINETQAPFDKSLLRGFVVNGSKVVKIDQGLDTNQIPFSQPIDSALKEQQYIIEIDNRLGSIVDPKTNQNASISYIDDDNIASYYFSLANDGNIVKDISTYLANGGAAGNGEQVIQGPRGTRLQFKIAASTDLQTSTYLFELLGATQSYPGQYNVSTYYYIDTIVRITGGQTGASVDLPVRFLKYKSTP